MLMHAKTSAPALFALVASAFSVTLSCGSDSAQSSGADSGVKADATGGGADGAGPMPQPPAVKGFADLHVHMMAEEAFGGAWMHGSHTGPLADCDGGLPPSNHARLKQNLSSMLNHCPNVSAIQWAASPALQALFSVGGAGASEFIGKIEGTQGDTGVHLGRRKAGSGFPRWDTVAHQTASENGLKIAHEKGLSLMVMSAVSFKFLCEAMPEANRKRPCSEVADVDLQLDLTKAFVTRNPWAEIALSPEDARRIIYAGKLAIVLSIEASNVFDESPDWLSVFERFYEKGVRTIQLVHQLDNRFAGAALHNPIFQVAQYTKSCHIDTDCGATVGSQTLGFDVDGECKNTKALTAEGEAFSQELMKRGMPIDIAHLSERGTAQLFDIARTAQYYPLYVSHGHFRELMNPELAKNEKTTPADVIRMLRQTGGIFGLRTAHDETRDYTRAKVSNDCHGSSKSFAQALEFGRNELKVPMALGSDFNGFIQQTRPRFGPNGACSAGFAAEADKQRALQSKPLGTDFDEKGLAHIGLLPDLLEDVRAMGVDTSPFDDSAERYIVMWERAQSASRKGWADEAANLRVENVAPYVPKDVRKAGL
jgi:microsomal dipeptidase-like Zn-dependent dipeptidase